MSSIDNIEELRKDYAELEERLRQVNAKLLKSEKLKSDFLSNIKNEINNPLTSILGLLNQVIVNPDNVKQTAINSSLIYNEVYALNFQMRNIFNAAEIEAGQSFPELSNLNIRHLVLDLIESFKPLSEKKGIDFDLIYEAADSFVSDRDKLEVILSNLMANAIKFSNSGAKVVIHVSGDSESNLCISVRDFGVGIETENMDKIYDRFRQLDTGTRKEFGGHGLGLSIVHSLVDILDGSLEMESKRGEGAFFEIRIPLNISHDILDMDDEVLFNNSDQEGEIF
ncbi:MAG: HAMP domain-containing sensor histidine kinase [Cyclobacteriaceae bacterium]